MSLDWKMDRSHDDGSMEYIDMVMFSLGRVPRKKRKLDLQLEPHQHLLLDAFVSATGKNRLVDMIKSGCSIKSIIVHDYFSRKGHDTDSMDSREMLEELCSMPGLAETIAHIRPYGSKNKEPYETGGIMLYLAAGSYLSIISSSARIFIEHSRSREDLRSILSIDYLFPDHAAQCRKSDANSPATELKQLLAGYYLNEKKRWIARVKNRLTRPINMKEIINEGYSNIISIEKKLDALQRELKAVQGCYPGEYKGMILDLADKIKKNKKTAVQRKKVMKSGMHNWLARAEMYVNNLEYSAKSVRLLGKVRRLTACIKPAVKKAGLAQELGRTERAISGKYALFKAYDESISRLKEAQSDIIYYSEMIDIHKPGCTTSSAADLAAYKSMIDDAKGKLSGLVLPGQWNERAVRLESMVSDTYKRISFKKRQALKAVHEESDDLRRAPSRHSYLLSKFMKKRIRDEQMSRQRKVQDCRTAYDILQGI